MKAPLIGMSRHRLVTDGAGVTTLVAFHGCPLRCRYCLNSSCWEPEGVWREVDVDGLLAETMVDDLYFKATGGGVTFGGGEPLLRADFIKAFAEKCPPEWNICLETSLHAPRHLLETLLPYISHYYIDIKDASPDIYQRYAGQPINLAWDNLLWLAEQGLQQRVTIRLPLIPDYNTVAERKESRRKLLSLGFHDFDLFTYKVT